MQIILLEKIANVGNLGDVVKVKDGFARNFLIPQGQGQARHAREHEADREQARRAREAPPPTSSPPRRRVAAKLEGLTVQIAQKAGVDGRLFGSVDQRRHRRGAEGAGHRGREGAGPHAGGTAEARSASIPVDGRAAHRRRRHITITVVARHGAGLSLAPARRAVTRRRRRGAFVACAGSPREPARQLECAVSGRVRPRISRPHMPDDPQVDALKLPPHSIEAEQSVLGGLLLDNDAADRIGDVVGAERFLRDAHRLIFDARDRG